MNCIEESTCGCDIVGTFRRHPVFGARALFPSCPPSVLEIDRYLGFTSISVSAKTADIMGLSRCWQNAVIFLTHPDNMRKKAQRSKSRQLSYSNASRCGFINKQTRLTMEHRSAGAAETKTSLIRLIKNHSKIFKLLQFEKFQLINPDFWNFWKKVRHKIHYIFDNEAENMI